MLIGINGFRGSGKDTVGKYLVENYGFTRLSFAQKLKESAAALFDIPVENWEEWKNDPHAEVGIEVGPIIIGDFDTPNSFCKYISVREFLQRYGTEAHRDIFGYNFWVDQCLKDYDPHSRAVITDARFENELEAISDLGGYTFRIERDTEGASDSHVSESVPPQHLLTATIPNNSSFEDLYSAVDRVMYHWCHLTKESK